jgi:hypothetical protein
MLAELVPVANPESVLSVVGILELVFCFALLLFKKAQGWAMCLGLLCLGAFWVGLERGNSSPDSFGTTKGWEILWRWDDGTFHDQSRWDYDSSDDSLYQRSKKERYYAMHVNGGISPRIFHPDSLWVAPLIVVVLGTVIGFIIHPELFVLLIPLLNWLFSHDD